VKRPIGAAVEGVLLHLPPPGKRRGRHSRQGRPRPGSWLVALGGLVAALGLLLWAGPWLGPLAGNAGNGGGRGIGGMALFGLGGVLLVAGLALTMADRVDPPDGPGVPGEPGPHHRLARAPGPTRRQD